MRGSPQSFANVAAVVCAIATVVLCSSCGGASTGTAATAESPRAGGTYDVPLAIDPVSIEPPNVQEDAGCLVARQVFEGLVRYELGADGCLHGAPGLAQSWTVSRDARVFTFTIRRGVTFQPPVGREVTAHDVKACWDYVTDPDHGSVLTYMFSPIGGTDDAGCAEHGLSGVKVLGRWTLRVTLKRPFADFPLTLGHTATMVWPVDYMEKVGHGVFQNRPVGTGPFMVERWDHGRSIDLVRNPAYWDSARRAHVDKVHFTIFTEPEAAWRAFEGGDLDLCQVPRDRLTTIRDDKRVRSGDWTVRRWPPSAVMYLAVNMRDPALGQNGDASLRRALAYALDRAAVIAQAAPSYEPATRLVPTGIPRAPLDPPYPESMAKARKLVAELGGSPTVAYLANTDTNGFLDLNGALRRCFAAGGIRLRISGYKWGKYLRVLTAGRGVQLFAMGWIADYPSADDFLYPLFHSSLAGPNSFTYYHDAAVDRLLDSARATLDERQRLRLYGQAERMILSDVPAVPVYFYRDAWVTSSCVRDQVLSPMQILEMWRVWVE